MDIDQFDKLQFPGFTHHLIGKDFFMAFDAFFLTSVLEEIRTRCLGARVDKLHQPSRDLSLIHI